MEQYIDKSAIVEEIKKLQKRYSEAPARNTYEIGLKEGRLIGYKDALHKLDTLEVKEVDLEKTPDKSDGLNESVTKDSASEDLEKEFNRFLDEIGGTPRMYHSEEQIEWGKDIAHHFANWQKQQMMKEVVRVSDLCRDVADYLETL